MSSPTHRSSRVSGRAPSSPATVFKDAGGTQEHDNYTDESTDYSSSEDDGPYMPVYHRARYQPCNFDEVENLEMYRPGGLYPTHTKMELLDDNLSDRYIIAAKLGCGASSTVWLAFDNQDKRYCALKIIAAERSASAEAEVELYRDLLQKTSADFQCNYLLPLYDTFWFSSANGRHLCIVMGVSGPSLCLERHHEDWKLRADLVHSVGADMGRGLCELHEAGFVYGDLNPRNIVFGLKNIDHLSFEDLLSIFGEDEDDLVLATPGQKAFAKRHAPLYVYMPLRFETYRQLALLEPKIKFIDFGGSFRLKDSPQEYYEHTRPYADPECVLLGSATSQESDIEATVNGEWLPIPPWEECIGPMPEELKRRVAEVEARREIEMQQARASLAAPAVHDHMEVDVPAREADLHRLGHTCERAQANAAGTERANASFFGLMEDIAHHATTRTLRAFGLRLGLDLFQPCSNLQHDDQNPTAPPPPAPMLSPLSPPSSSSSASYHTPISPVVWYTTRKDRGDMSLPGRLRAIGKHKNWHHLTLPQRAEFLVTQRQADTAKITRERLIGKAPYPERLSEEELRDMQDLLGKLLMWDHEGRATAKQVLDHPWLRGGYDLRGEGVVRTYEERAGRGVGAEPARRRRCWRLLMRDGRSVLCEEGTGKGRKKVLESGCLVGGTRGIRVLDDWKAGHETMLSLLST